MAWIFCAQVFRYFATGPLKQMMLEFYAASGDFTRRLTSVRANSKFSAPFAGPEDYFTVSLKRSGIRSGLMAHATKELLNEGHRTTYQYLEITGVPKHVVLSM